MKRIIKDFSTINDREKLMIREKFPNGINHTDFTEIKSSNGSYLHVLEVRTSDVIYLIKYSQDLLKGIEEMTENDHFEGAPA